MNYTWLSPKTLLFLVSVFNAWMTFSKKDHQVFEEDNLPVTKEVIGGFEVHDTLTLTGDDYTAIIMIHGDLQRKLNYIFKLYNKYE